MSLIESFDDLVRNAEALEVARAAATKGESENYRSLVRKGRVWLPYLVKDQLSFGPSRFMGYRDNTVSRHMVREDRDGRITNIRILEILRKEFGFKIFNIADSEIETQFIRFCSSLSITPDSVNRSYWITPDVANWLDRNLADGEAKNHQEREVMDDISLPKTTREAVVLARIGQGLFRRRVISAYQCCIVTGIHERALLTASHIKPWRDCRKNPDECLTHDNALLLSPTWDRLFDRGFVSFSDEGKLLMAEKLSDASRKALGVRQIVVKLTRGQVSFMPHHRALHGFNYRLI